MIARWIPKEFVTLFHVETLFTALRILGVVLVSFVILKIIAFVVGQLVKRRITEQSLMILKKAITYTGVVVILMIVLAQLGLSLAALLGAAGIFGIAIGFAAQTSVSNVISGMFLISEKAFAVGDVIKVGSTLGIVLTIDLLSVKIRTFDNQFIRLPNETLIKSEVVNITRFPIRRLNIEFTVGYETDLPVLKELLFRIARSNPASLDDPEPFYVIKGFGRFGVDILFGVWFARENFVRVKNSMLEEIHRTITEAGIRIPVAPPAVSEAHL